MRRPGLDKLSVAPEAVGAAGTLPCGAPRHSSPYRVLRLSDASGGGPVQARPGPSVSDD